MRYLWLIMLISGIYFLASAATESGLLPSGHGTGRLSEVVLGTILVAYSIYRFRRQSKRKS